jgi:hypothetical protein
MALVIFEDLGSANRPSLWMGNMTTPIHPFDLQARAELATHGLTGLLDSDRDGLMYFLGNWRARPARADHGLWDCGDGRPPCGRADPGAPHGEQKFACLSPAAGDEQLEGWMLRFLGE